MLERLQKIISRAGLASRRTAEDMIVQGRVRVDGRVVTELGAKADPEKNKIQVDGRWIRPDRPRRYVLLNKPRGYVTTKSDPGARPTVMELLPKSLQSLYPVGRLDMGTTGLLLLTDDGEFAQHVAHPRFGIEKTYLVTVRGCPTEKTLSRARVGVRVEGQKLRVKSAELLSTRLRSPSKPRSKKRPHQAAEEMRVEAPIREALKAKKKQKSVLRVVLIEGKNREVRRLFKALGHPVLELHRSKVAFLTDRELGLGAYRPLTPYEVRRFRREARAAT
jgi:pseudouridine synthase